MEMESIFKSISDTITEIENEKEAAEKAACKKQVDKALKGIEDLKEIIHHIMENFSDKEKIRKMKKDSIIISSCAAANETKHHYITIKDQPWGTTKSSPLFENEFVDSIYKKGNLREIYFTIDQSKTENMLVEELGCESISIRGSRNFSIKIDGCWFEIWIKPGIHYDMIDQISFMVD